MTDGYDLEGRTMLVTGAASGIGYETALALVRRGARVHVGVRSAARAAEVLEAAGDIEGPGSAALVAMDLADFASVHAGAAAFIDSGEPLHVLINNAGVAGQRGMTDDGFELAFGINHLGHFLLTMLLLPRLRSSSPSHVVTVASVGHRQARGIDFERVREPTKVTGLGEYAASKLANVLFTQELARRESGTGVTTYSLHPGSIGSDIWRRLPWPIEPVIKTVMRSSADGAVTSLYCATAPELAGQSGRYYDHSQEKQASRRATPELAAELWTRSEQWTGATWPPPSGP